MENDARLKEWKTARQIENFIIDRMKSDDCVTAVSVAVEASGTGWVARTIGLEISDPCKRQFEAACRVAQAKFKLRRDKA